MANYNELMVQGMDSIERLQPWRHAGLGIASLELMSDGVHPDTEEGLRVYINSISRACRQVREYEV